MIASIAAMLWFDCAEATAQSSESLFSPRTLRCQQAMLDTRKVELADAVTPFAGFSSDPYSFGVRDRCHVVAFYRLFDVTPYTREQRLARAPRQIDRTPRFIARILIGSRDEWAEHWADQDSCAAMEPALAALSSVVTPKFIGERADDVEYALPLDSGVDYAFWSRDKFYPIDASYDRYNLEIRSNTDTPIARWIDSTLASILSCAKPSRPAGL